VEFMDASTKVISQEMCAIFQKKLVCWIVSRLILVHPTSTTSRRILF